MIKKPGHGHRINKLKFFYSPRLPGALFLFNATGLVIFIKTNACGRFLDTSGNFIEKDFILFISCLFYY